MSAIQRILLVDDEPDIQAIAAAALRALAGWEVTTATTGEEALAAARQMSFDVVVLDVNMGDMDGPTVLARLLDQGGSRTPVVFLTAQSRPSDVEALRALGAAGVVSKPFDPMTLHLQIRAAVGEG